MHLKISNNIGLSDLLNYAHFVGEGIIINKDGAFLTTYKFSGPDIHSATNEVLDSLVLMFNRVAILLDDGWMLHIDEVRIPSIDYPSENNFPSLVADMIDQERKYAYEKEGIHFENWKFITFVWKFPLPIVKTAHHWFVTGIESNKNETLEQLFKLFQDKVDQCISLLTLHLIMNKLNNADLLSFLNICITGELATVAVPIDEAYLDVVLARAEINAGYYPKINDKYLRVLSLTYYVHEDIYPGWLEDIMTYPLVYRFSNRFIPLSTNTAEREIKRYKKDWHNKSKGLAGVIKEAITGRVNLKINEDAMQMYKQACHVSYENLSEQTRIGYWTSNIILLHENVDVLTEATQYIRQYIERRGFTCLPETLNAMDAWLGSIPGHGSANIRRLWVNSRYLGCLLPLASIWSGQAFSDSASLLPEKSPPVFYAATTGKTPFRWQADIDGVGHTQILGPTGSGKSTFIDLYVAQFFRYKNAQVFIFDKDFSHAGLTYSLNGRAYFLGEEKQLSFCPLANLSTKKDQLRAITYIENLIILQNVILTPEKRQVIHRAILLLSDNKFIGRRSLTLLSAFIQHSEIKEALSYYTVDGPFSLLDATFDNLDSSYLLSFEMNWLLQQAQEIYVPVLSYLFDVIEKRIEDHQGKYPTLLVLEEAWLYLENPLFSIKLKNWLKTLRKFNARVIFSTQSLSDLYDDKTQSLTSVTATIQQECFIKVFLPNKEIDDNLYFLYKKLGLNDREIEIIKEIAIPRKHYFLKTSKGNRLLDLGFDECRMALAFLGLGKEKTNALFNFYEKHGKDWVFFWLKQQGFNRWAKYWKSNGYC